MKTQPFKLLYDRPFLREEPSLHLHRSICFWLRGDRAQPEGRFHFQAVLPLNAFLFFYLNRENVSLR